MKASWFARGDLDGFFGLFVDNLLQLMLIVLLCPFVCGIPIDQVITVILPGAALSILVGNLFYSWQAWKLSKENPDITALPYGINTVSLFAYIFLIMGPVYQRTQDADLAWKAGVFACFLGGILECLGAFVGSTIRKITPRAALLSALAGVAITFISMGFIFQLFDSPLMAIPPMMIILAAYASKTRLPMGLPAGLLAVIVGTALGWLLPAEWTNFQGDLSTIKLQFCPPVPVIGELIGFISHPDAWNYFAIILPMALFNIIGSLQNLESAEAAGDKFDTRSSLLANGFGSIVAACFGSAFPTTIYIGHPGWKAMGSRVSYSALNGIVVAILILAGGMSLVQAIIPIEATLGILLWIGLTITAQAFQAVPPSHTLAVAMGLIPCLASWAELTIEQALRVAGTTIEKSLEAFPVHDVYIHGIISLHQGFLISSMIFAAIVVHLVDRSFRKAAYWTLAAAVCSTLGLIHAYQLSPNGIKPVFGLWVNPEFTLAYLLSAGLFFFLSFQNESKGKKS